MPQETRNDYGALEEAATPYSGRGLAEPADVDISLLEASLRMSPWERMLANDDALNFGESLSAAMAKRNAKP
jgi:hypothetical protein